MSPPPLEGIDGQGRPPLLHRLLGRRHPANALTELRSLLADAPGPRSVLPEDVTAIDRRFGIDVRRRFQAEIQGIYREFLARSLEDRRFSEQEVEESRHLAGLLGLSDEVCGLLQRKVAREVYLRSIEEVMDDGTVDEEERAFLRELQARLRIPGEVADNMEQVRRRQLRSRGRWEEETGG